MQMKDLDPLWPGQEMCNCVYIYTVYFCCWYLTLGGWLVGCV